ncbi:MAG: nucleotidyl transferase AbiEii/AbiGii toxin family protein [Synergistaceae bacterium]|nr:nucleotidyl transferase AbiEii/AbiGii toxin family protein [Synergistaceae bacterium]
MRNVARLSNNDRKELFRNTADRMGLNDAIVEKDFWVCFMLDYLFHRSQWKDVITFKGGTSLSKAFHLINRFSEDIDLILDWRVLGYGKDEPWERRSNTKQDAFNKEANARAEAFLSETFCPCVKMEISEELGSEATLYIDKNDKQTVIFAYPNLFSNAAALQVIRLEIGALAAWTPARQAAIEPYAAKYYPAVFEQANSSILTVAPERTFWEKATILHHEANRPPNLKMPLRYSRHYYDLYSMINNNSAKEAACLHLELLKKVVDFKMKFYPRLWAKYEDASPGTLKLVPPEYRFAALQADYKAMKDMIYGEIPAFETMLASIRALEKEINSSGL